MPETNPLGVFAGRCDACVGMGGVSGPSGALSGAVRGCVSGPVGRDHISANLIDSPQPQASVTLGLLNLNPASSRLVS